MTREELIAHFEEVVDELERFEELQEKYPFVEKIWHDELTQESYDRLLELDKKNRVWTVHGTCEREQLTSRFLVFGDCELLGQERSGCGCFQSQVYYISSVPHKREEDEYDFTYVESDAFCPECNKDGDREDASFECPGPDLTGIGVGEIDSSECDFGKLRFYFI